MENISNKILYIIGALLCVSYVVIPADSGLLGDGISTAMEVLAADIKLLVTMFLLPTLLAVIAGVMLFAGKNGKVTFIMACLGALLYLGMDFHLASHHQAYLGCYMNAVGAVLIMAGTALEAFAESGGKEGRLSGERTEQLDAGKTLFYENSITQTAAEDSAPIIFSDVFDQEHTDFNKGIAEMFIDEEQEERIHEKEEDVRDRIVADTGDDHDYSNDSFWR